MSWLAGRGVLRWRQANCKSDLWVRGTAGKGARDHITGSMRVVKRRPWPGRISVPHISWPLKDRLRWRFALRHGLLRLSLLGPLQEKRE